MKEHNKKFYSLEELKRTRDNLEGYLDNEEVYYFVGTIRYACDEIERLQREKEELQVNGLRQEILFKLEIKRLHNIIKEVRELLNQEWYVVLRKRTITKVKEILDKEN